jgi:hypothetical protein
MRLNSITVADHPDAWQAAGFTVIDNHVTIGNSLVFHLTGTPDGGAVSWALGVDGRDANDSCDPGGLTLNIENPIAPEPASSHENGVSHVMKAVILTADTSASLARLHKYVPELGAPPVEGHSDDGAHYAIWPMIDCEVGLEVVCLNPDHGNDTMAAVFLVVEDLDKTITRIGANDVTPIEIYGGRRMVRIKPRIGVTAGIHLIAKAP